MLRGISYITGDFLYYGGFPILQGISYVTGISYITCYRGLRRDCQMLLSSATYDQQVMTFAQAVVPNPVVIRLRREEESLNNIKQYFINCKSPEDKFQALSNIYGAISIGQSMIFCHVSSSYIMTSYL